MSFHRIKNRILERASVIWGVDAEDIQDPILDLMLDVFAFEFEQIHHSIKESDSKLLERLASLLVNNEWFRPMPAHALLSATPKANAVLVNEQSKFYINKYDFGEKRAELYFTPLFDHEFVNASIYCTVTNREVFLKRESGDNHLIIENAIKKNTKFTESTIYLGIEIDENVLLKQNEFKLCLALENSNLDKYLKITEASDIAGNSLKLEPFLEEKVGGKSHYYRQVINYYKDFLFTINLTNSEKKLNKVQDVIEINTNELEEIVNKKLFWVKLQFAPIFSSDKIDTISISLNTVPVVNRNLINSQHEISKSGRIVALNASQNEYFLEVENIVDNHGINFENILQKEINETAGSFSIYNGNIEQFDRRSAKSILRKMLQVVREEGSSFSSVGYDLLNAYLDELNDKLKEMETKLVSKYNDVDDHNERSYLMLSPFETTENIDYSYWITNAHIANGPKAYTRLNTVHDYGLKPNSIAIQTKVLGGKIKSSNKEKISSLRYGILSRDRIVSKEDVKELVRMTLGKSVKDVTVTSGVGIGIGKKKGIQRTTVVTIEMIEQASQLNNKLRMAHYISNTLEEKSVHNMSYKVKIL